jgi:hypothetical protein
VDVDVGVDRVFGLDLALALGDAGVVAELDLEQELAGADAVFEPNGMFRIRLAASLKSSCVSVAGKVESLMKTVRP